MSVFERIWNWIKEELGGVEPALEAWFKKFLSDEGKVLLAAALLAAQEVATGKSIQQAGTDLVAQLAAQGVTVAMTDALDAIRTQLSYLQTRAPVITAATEQPASADAGGAPAQAAS